MIVLGKSDDNKLFVMTDGNTECKPWCLETTGNHVKLRSILPKGSLYEGHFSDFSHAEDPENGFASLSELMEFVTPALGFKTAPGGSGASANKNADLIKTGQIFSYDFKDDGALQLGRGIDFFTLWESNIFGNNNRFTDLTGDQDYNDDIVLDHSTFDGEKMLGYSRIPFSPDSWDSQLQVCGEEPGWAMTNIRQLQNITHYGETSVLSYAPFNLPSAGFFTSTTVLAGTTNVFLCQPAGWIGTASKGSANYAIRCRHFHKSELVH